MTKLLASDGTRWAFMRRQDIADLENPAETYLTRWRLVATPAFGVYLHRIAKADTDRSLHDHPWSFASLVLSGGYLEQWCASVPMGVMRARLGITSPARVRLRGSMHRMRRGAVHRISFVIVPTWTLVFVGPRRGDWGYATPEGWVDHDTMHARWGLTPDATLTRAFRLLERMHAGREEPSETRNWDRTHPVFRDPDAARVARVAQHESDHPHGRDAA